MIGRRPLLAVAAVVDIALHARGRPVAARALADRNGLAPRHLEVLLQDLVRAGFLKGTRGPNGGYELARERRRVTVGAIVRAVGRVEDGSTDGSGAVPPSGSALLDAVVLPTVTGAFERFLEALDAVTVEDLCRQAERERPDVTTASDFHI